MATKDYYAILGVKKNATDKEIKQAYRRLARKHHPDVNPGNKEAEEKFKEINEAFSVLGDPEKRKQYDEFGIDRSVKGIIVQEVDASSQAAEPRRPWPRRTTCSRPTPSRPSRTGQRPRASTS